MVRITFFAVLAAVIPALAVPISPDPAGEKNIGNGQGTQFIGGQCLSSADCASTCCAVVTGQNFGLCSGLGAQFQAGKAGCGFGDGAAAQQGAAQGANGSANGAAQNGAAQGANTQNGAAQGANTQNGANTQGGRGFKVHQGAN
ncbi:hypothetical protein F5Y04DRAFT_285653 [Hypomontagnella monticulosa]|nr:hypothetical protein F5Y04DRAFT_285653 [Hypomontagnella monticulosa]